MHLPRLSLLLVLGTAPLPAAETVLAARALHLGRPGAYEWEEFKDRPVDGERFSVQFKAKANLGEQTLRLRQSNVKLTWTVRLNSERLGTLTPAETPQECLLALPAGRLREGDNELVIEPPPGLLDDIELGPVILDDRPVQDFLSGAEVQVTVTDATGAPLPCRLTLTRPDGTLQPLRATPADAVATRTGVVYTRDGRATLSVPPGDYLLQAGRGFEWGVARRELRLTRGAREEVSLQLQREVDTTGWLAADSHIHTRTHSGHGDAELNERVLTIAGEGIELAIATDHNHAADHAPAAAALGLATQFTPIIGNEVTTKHGHFNTFPISPGAPLPDHRLPTWSELLPAIRATPGVQVVILNHPRDVHSGFTPLGGLQFNPGTGRHRDAEALTAVDGIEVLTSAAMQTDVHLLFRDWFALLNRGHHLAAVGSSDSHDVNRFLLGQGRTYVAADDRDPARPDLAQVWRSYREGRLLVSLGLLTQLRVDDRFSVGDLASGLGERVRVEVSVQGPAWTRADRVELYANGILVREQALDDPGRAGEKARVAWELPRPAHDVHLVALATGPGVTEPFWEIPRPYQPSSKAFTPRVLGATNPVWLDADGDGRFSAAFTVARGLIDRHGQDKTALKAALQACDAAVATQARSLGAAP
jgi:hypothetical protein